MEFSERKTELAVLSITEGTEFIANSIDDGVWEAKYEITGGLIDGFDSWDWPCL